MKFYFKIISLIVLALLLQCCSKSNPVEPEPQQNVEKIKQIDALCDSVLSAYPAMSSILVGAWDETQNFTLTKAYGISDKAKKTPANINMVARVGSITKTFTVTIALKLVEQGKLSLDDKIEKYLPEYTKYKDITIKMLCNMTSGIRDYADDSNFDNFFLQNNEKGVSPTQIIDFIYPKSLAFTPGKRYSYSNTNIILLGMIIEKISNEKIENLIKNQLITPLGLKHTYFPTGKLMPESNFLNGYYENMDFSELGDVSFAWSAGAMVSNIFDLKIWIEKVIKGNLLSKETQELRFDGFKDNNEVVYGLGIYSIGQNLWGHGGTVIGYQSIAVTDRTKNRTFVVIYNTIDDYFDPEYIVNRITQIIK